MKRQRKNFSLIELLIVIGILGALLSLVLPGFSDTSDDAKEKVAMTEMREIQKQFQRFYADLASELRTNDGTSDDPTNNYMQDIALYGIWPLMIQKHPVFTADDEDSDWEDYESYSSDSDFGWRGPYLEYEAIAGIMEPILTYDGNESSSYDTEDGSVTTSGGQVAESGSTIKVPVIKDPYGGYYRILCPEERTTDGNSLSEYDRLKRMVVVCTGRNKKLDTTTDNFIDKDDADYVKSINGDDIVASGDDIVMRLIPMAY